VDIHPAATFGRGILLDHATGVVIGETAVVGDNVSMLHHVTLGGSGTGSGVRHPTIGHGVLLGAGGWQAQAAVAGGEGACGCRGWWGRSGGPRQQAGARSVLRAAQCTVPRSPRVQRPPPVAVLAPSPHPLPRLPTPPPAAGVSVLGPITVGAGTKVGAGSVVVTDLPCHSVAVGVPARIIKRDAKREPATDMDMVDDFVLDFVI
jgi:hypothetical protein